MQHIFSQPFWLDAVAPNQWDVIEIKKGNQLQARLPYVWQKRYFGLKMITMPKLTQTLSPWLASYDAKYVNQLSQQHELMSALIEQLPPFDYFSQNFHYSVTNCLPFVWNGFQQRVRYTYVIDNLTDIDYIWQEMRGNIRREIRKAKKRLIVRTDLSLDKFLDLNELTFERQNMATPYSREFVMRLDQACQQNNCRKIFFAEDAQGQPHAAVYIVWDSQAAYYLMGGADPGLRNSGATSFLMWEAIKFASTVTQKFDFEGSIVQPIERFFRAFGARQKPYFQITKINSLRLKMRWDVASWVRLWRNNNGE